MKRTVGLALGSGGPRGLSHIGVIKALEEAGISPTVVTGTSVGSMIGGFYSALANIGVVERIFADIKLTELALMFSDITFRSGIIKGDRLEDFLVKHLGTLNIEDLPKKYAAVATNIITAEEMTVVEGSLTKAIRASSTLPTIIDPYNDGKGYLIDGGVSQPVPVRAARKIGADFVIAVNLDSYSYVQNSAEDKPGMTKIGTSALKLLRHSLSQELCREADVVIVPDVAQYAWLNLTKKADRVEIIRRGYESAQKMLPEIESKLA